MLTDNITFPEKFEKLLEDRDLLTNFMLCYPIFKNSVQSLDQVNVILESIFGFFKRSEVLFKGLLIAAAFLGTMGEKTETLESRGCQIDKKKIIVDITEEFYSIKQLCLKYLKLFLTNCGPEQKPLIQERKLELLQIIKDFIENTLSLELITAALQIFDKVQLILDDGYDYVNMEIFLSSVLETKYHQLAKLDILAGHIKNSYNKAPKTPSAHYGSVDRFHGQSVDHDSEQHIEISVGESMSDAEFSNRDDNEDPMVLRVMLEGMLSESRGPAKIAGNYEIANFLKRDEGLCALIDMLINPLEVPLSPIVDLPHLVGTAASRVCPDQHGKVYRPQGDQTDGRTHGR